MELTNRTNIHEFLLIGFRVDQHYRFLLLIFFTILYVLTLIENITIIMLVLLDAQLSQLPMYILLSNFSWMEICYVTSSVPRIIFDLASSHQVISFHECFIQFYFFFSLGTTEFFFLSAMALDRYVAICYPLRYPQIMSSNFCYVLVALCWIFGFLAHVVPLTLTFRLSFCGLNIIDHILCDYGPLLSLACPPVGNAPLISQITMYLLFFSNVIFVILSYSIVIFTLVKSSDQGSWRKAFATIAMHLLVVTIFYGSVGGVYLIPGGENQSEITKMGTAFYAAVTPFVNPLIYCLRNDEVKKALGRVLRRMMGLMLRNGTV